MALQRQAKERSGIAIPTAMDRTINTLIINISFTPPLFFPTPTTTFIVPLSPIAPTSWATCVFAFLCLLCEFCEWAESNVHVWILYGATFFLRWFVSHEQAGKSCVLFIVLALVDCSWFKVSEEKLTTWSCHHHYRLSKLQAIHEYSAMSRSCGCRVLSLWVFHIISTWDFLVFCGWRGDS